MRSALRDRLLAVAFLAGCASAPDQRIRDRDLEFLMLDCIDRVPVGLERLVRELDVRRSRMVREELRSCVDLTMMSVGLRDALARTLAAEPNRTLLVELLVRERQLALDLLARVPVPTLRPYLGVPDQASLRAAVTMDDVERHESIPETWRRWISARAGYPGTLELSDALRDPALACLAEPSSPTIRREIIRRIRELASGMFKPGVVPYVVRERHNPDPLIRRETMRLFSMVTTCEKELREAAVSDPDLRVRATAFAGLEDVTGIPVPDYLRRP